MARMSEEQKKNLSEKMMGNKNGVNKRKPFIAALTRNVLQHPKTLEKNVEKLLQQAEDGEAWAVKEVIDRLDGKAVQIQEISGPDGNAIEIEDAGAFAKELMQEMLMGRQKESSK